MDYSESLLTTEDCYRILKDYTNRDKFVLKSYVADILSSIEGFLGQCYKLKIIYKEDAVEKEINLFLKDVATPFKALEYVIKSLRAYEKEEFYVSYLLKEFKDCGISTAFAPRCYYCRPSVLVFEDLTLRGYKNAPKKEMLDIKHCKVALKTLARFHASTIIFQKIKSCSDNAYSNLEKLYPELLENIFYSEKNNAGTDWIERTFIGVLSLIDLLPKSNVGPETYKSKLKEILKACRKPLKTSKNCITTILHGDLWSNNFMFKYQKDIPVDSILIDYQILRYGPIALDVTHMLLTNLRRNVRSVHYEELLSYYYHQLVEVCDELGFNAHDFVSFNDFIDSCEELKVRAKIECIADHSLTFLTEALVEDALKSEEELNEFTFGDRSNSMKHSYKTDDLYREVMTEDLIELSDLLFKKKVNVIIV